MKKTIKALIGFIFFFPIIYMLMGSFMLNPEELFFGQGINAFTLKNWIDAFTNDKFWMFYSNTVLVSAIVFNLQVVIGTLTAYALTLKERKVERNLIFVSLMIPQQAIFLPIFLVLSKLTLVNTFTGIIICEFVSVTFIQHMRNEFMSVNPDLIKSGKIDGMNTLQLLIHVYLSQVKDAFLYETTVAFINCFNIYFWAKILSNKESKYLLTIGLKLLRKTGGTDFVSNQGELFTESFLSIIPVLIIYLLGRYIIERRSHHATFDIK